MQCKRTLVRTRNLIQRHRQYCASPAEYQCVSKQRLNDGTKECLQSWLPDEARFSDIRRRCPAVDKLIERKIRVDGTWISDVPSGPNTHNANMRNGHLRKTPELPVGPRHFCRVVLNALTSALQRLFRIKQSVLRHRWQGPIGLSVGHRLHYFMGPCTGAPEGRMPAVLAQWSSFGLRYNVNVNVNVNRGFI